MTFSLFCRRPFCFIHTTGLLLWLLLPTNIYTILETSMPWFFWSSRKQDDDDSSSYDDDDDSSSYESSSDEDDEDEDVVQQDDHEKQEVVDNEVEEEEEESVPLKRGIEHHEDESEDDDMSVELVSDSYESHEFETDDDEDSSNSSESLDGEPHTSKQEDEEDIDQEKVDDVNDEEDEPSDNEDEEQVTTLEEKQALILLAAEHDRVDILKSILSVTEKEDYWLLLNGRNDDSDKPPPLHVAIAHGSMQVTQTLLRMGADPSIPFENKTAWDVAFVSSKTNLSPSKVQGLRHAFTAEALRCIGGNEGRRLQQLLDSGMPFTYEIADKALYEWAVEMGSLDCEEILRPEPPDEIRHEEKEQVPPKQQQQQPSSISDLMNRLDELDSLADALATCLDGLAQEGSVCHGLLQTQGGAAAALASHVQGLKEAKSGKTQELMNLQTECQELDDQLQRLLRQHPSIVQDVEKRVAPLTGAPGRSLARSLSLRELPQEDQMKQLQGQIAASETKIHQLRASMADLSEENARALQEIQRRGLSGGIQLVRGLKEELQDLDYALDEWQSVQAERLARIHLIESRVQSTAAMMAPPPSSSSQAQEDTTDNHIEDEQQEQHAEDLVEDREEEAIQAYVESSTTTNLSHQESYESVDLDSVVVEQSGGEPTEQQQQGGESSTEMANQRELVVEQKAARATAPSEKIRTGDSQAIVQRTPGGPQAHLSSSLWQILMRIIGLDYRTPAPPPPPSSSTHAATTNTRGIMVV